MKKLAIFFKQYSFTITAIVMAIYSGYILWFIYQQTYIPLIQEPTPIITTTKEYRIPDLEINAKLDAMQENPDNYYEINPDELSFGIPFENDEDQTAESTEVNPGTLPAFGIPN